MTTLPAPAACAITALAGALGWLLVMVLGDRREAWDSPLYFSWFMPSLGVIVAGTAFFAPERPWRWAVASCAAQALVLFVQNPGGSLLPLGLVALALLAGGLAVPALLAAGLRRRIDRAA